MSISQRLQSVQSRVDEATRQAGRDVGSVKLLAVSKNFDATTVQEVFETGHRFLGESYAQELRTKAEALSHLNPEWHFIGRVQTNKAKWIAAHAHMVHTITSPRHATSIAKHCSTPLKCLIQVNIGKEESKGGVLPSDTLALAHEISKVNNVQICGLMSLPPRVDQPEQAAPYFEAMAELAYQGQKEGLPLTELSMGMSHDFEIAIRYGATMVRIGRSIFGQRR